MPPKEASWHSLESRETLDKLDSSSDGLSKDEAADRLDKHGPNSLPSAPRRPAWRRLLAQFHNVLIYILIAAGILAGALGHLIDAGVIMAVVVINAIIGFVQEGKAEQAMEAIGRMLALKARVLRDGRWQDQDAETLVPGDVVRIKAGDRVPADLRLLETHGLRIDQAALTGESLPVGKQAEAVADETDLADRHSMAHSGAMVTNGQATGAVVATGRDTELGHISSMLEQVVELTTPLLRRINRFGQVLTVVILVMAVAVVALGYLVHDLPLGDGLLAGIALAVAAIPEGLPAIITITLAVGVQHMASRKAIIRRLPAVETLGSVTAICSDKTGTLTRNELRVRAIARADATVHPEHEDFTADWANEILRAAVLASDHEPGSEGGDPLERALIDLTESTGLDPREERQNHPRRHLIPFSSDHKFMASLTPGQISIKGAPEVLLERCTRQHAGNEDSSFDDDFWHAKLERLTGEGLRVLAIAHKQVDESLERFDIDPDLNDLTLLGLVGFADPPRDGVREAVASCQRAGIRVKMITGDHAATALAIARELGIGRDDPRAMSGREIDGMDDQELGREVGEIDVFARTTPEHKLRLVQALQADEQIVAMTGDGANDAPALKRADIGVAMGIKGTEAARQASEMVLADDNFTTIVSGVEAGRAIYDNIRKAILFLLPTNAAQALVVVLAVIAGLALPITPVQILWVNMVVAVTLALALAFEPGEDDLMLRAPRPPGQSLLSSFVIARVLWVGALLTAGTFGFHSAVLTATGSEDLARTMAVNVLVAGQLTYLFNCRRWQQSSMTTGVLLTNPWSLLAAGVLVVLQMLFTYLPATQTVFATQALPLAYWPMVIGFALLVFVLVEAEKAITRAFELPWAALGESPEPDPAERRE